MLTVSFTNGGKTYFRVPSEDLLFSLAAAEEGVILFLILESMATISYSLIAREP